MSDRSDSRKKKPTVKADVKPVQKPLSFGAFPDEIERWREKARRADRTLSWWIRNRLLLSEAQDDETATRMSERADGETRELIR